MSFGIAIFPYLKTSGRFRLGPFMFRSTDDLDDLPPEQQMAVREVVAMLFLKDDLQIASATFAIVQAIDVDRRSDEIALLDEARAVVAYAYSSPHEIFDNIFLKPEDISLVVLSPTKVSKYLVYSKHHVIPTQASLERRVAEDEQDMVQGYAGLYNFVEPMWVVPGSRIYPPRPQAVLNISQDMAAQFAGQYSNRAGVGHLLSLLDRLEHPSRDRIFTAIRWYNHANESLAGPDRALLNLAVAFEALFNLPDNAKSERLADSISLILGRTERISVWATQFYAARSRVAHEGAAREIYFRPPSGGRSASEERFGTLMLSGRSIFQLCMSTLLLGMTLADEAGLADKLVSNTERFTRICLLLREMERDPAAGLDAIAPVVRQIAKHRYVRGTPTEYDLMLGALRLAAGGLLACEAETPANIQIALRLCAEPASGAKLFERLGSVFQLSEALKVESAGPGPERLRTVRQLVEEVWLSTFTTYFALKREQENAQGN